MRLRLGYKLFLTVLATSLLSIVLMSAVMRYFVQRDFEEFNQKVEMERMGEIIEKLSDVYRRDSGWRSLAQDPRVFQQILRPEFAPHGWIARRIILKTASLSRLPGLKGSRAARIHPIPSCRQLGSNRVWRFTMRDTDS